jgi:hypothetical protein
MMGMRMPETCWAVFNDRQQIWEIDTTG